MVSFLPTAAVITGKKLANDSPPCRAKYAWSYTSTVPYICTGWYLVKHQELLSKDVWITGTSMCVFTYIWYKIPASVQFLFTGGTQTEIRQEPLNENYILSSWDSDMEPAVSGWGCKTACHSGGTSGVATRRALSSWGGKRDAAFHSWGGRKRSHEPTAVAVGGSKRRPAFSSWGGKRDPSFGSLGDKGDAFAISILSSKDEPAFRTWGSESAPLSTLNPKQDTAFSSVDAKSDPALNIFDYREYPALSIVRSNYKPTPAVSIAGSKRAFSSWGGKRGLAFGSWGGKRDLAFGSWGGKTGAVTPEWEHASDHARGGKRGFDGDERETRSFSGWSGKWNLISGGMKEAVDELGKRRFSSWGGKRDMTQTKEIGSGDVEEQSPADNDGSTKTSSAEGYQQLRGASGRNIQPVHENSNDVTEDPEETAVGGKSHSPEPAEEEQQRPGAQNVTASAIAKRSGGRPRVSKALFGPWGGKRSDVLTPALFSVLGGMHRGAGGLRLLSEWFNKRGLGRSETTGSKKWAPAPAGAVFSSWGGKRSEKFAARSTPKTGPQGSGRQYRRGADFYSWGGKR
jgi:hypothetical protein